MLTWRFPPSVRHQLGIALKRLGRYLESLEELRRTWKLSSGPELPYEIGLVLMSLGQYDLARKEFERAALTQENPQVHFQIGRLYMQQRKFEQAEEQLRIGLELAKNDVQLRFSLAQCSAQLGKDEEALSDSRASPARAYRLRRLPR